MKNSARHPAEYRFDDVQELRTRRQRCSFDAGEPVTSAITLLDAIRRMSCLDMCQEAASHDRYSRDKWRF